MTLVDESLSVELGQERLRVPTSGARGRGVGAKAPASEASRGRPVSRIPISVRRAVIAAPGKVPPPRTDVCSTLGSSALGLRSITWARWRRRRRTTTRGMVRRGVGGWVRCGRCCCSMARSTLSTSVACCWVRIRKRVISWCRRLVRRVVCLGGSRRWWASALATRVWSIRLGRRLCLGCRLGTFACCSTPVRGTGRRWMRLGRRRRWSSLAATCLVFGRRSVLGTPRVG